MTGRLGHTQAFPQPDPVPIRSQSGLSLVKGGSRKVGLCGQELLQMHLGISWGAGLVSTHFPAPCFRISCPSCPCAPCLRNDATGQVCSGPPPPPRPRAGADLMGLSQGTYAGFQAGGGEAGREGGEKARGAWKGICTPPILAPQHTCHQVGPRVPTSQCGERMSLARVSSTLFSILVRKDLAFTREAAVTWTPVDPHTVSSGSLPSDRGVGFHPTTT